MRSGLHLVHADARPAQDVAAGDSVHVVLAEDHVTMRRSLRQLLDSERDIRVVAEAPDLEAAITEVRGHRPDVLVLDLRMPNGSSIDLVQRIRAGAPETKVVVITMHDGRAFAEQAHFAGALGYVLKDTADTELADAVRSAAQGQEYTSPRITPPVIHPKPR